MKLKNEFLNVAFEFYKKGNSIKDVVEFLKKDYDINIHPEVLRKRFRKAGIVLRNNRESITLSRRKHINISEIVKGYEKSRSIRDLCRNSGVSRETIRKILQEREINILSNDEAIQIKNLKYTKIPFDENIQNKAYLYGFVLGDVHVFKKSKFTLRAITHTTHKNFVDLFKSEFGRYGHLNCRYIQKKREWCLFIDLDYKSFSFLEDRTKLGLPDWISNNNFLSFLSGFIDSDGSIIVRKSGKYFQYVIRLFGQDKELLKQIKETLEKMGFRPTFYRNFEAGRTRMWGDKVMKYNKDYYAVDIFKKSDSLQLLRLLKLRHYEKIIRRELALGIYQRGLILWDDIKKEVLKLREQIRQEVQSRPG